MKKLRRTFISLLLAATLVIALVPITAAQGDYIYIPDPNFAARVRIVMGLPEGAPIPRAMAVEVTELWAGRGNITSLAGIEYFAALERLDVNTNNLTTLDVSRNPLLTELWVHDNNLTELDVSENPKLREIGVWNNNLTILDVSNNPLLEGLGVHNNDMNSPDDVIGWRDNENLILGDTFRFYPQREAPAPLTPSPWAAAYVARAVELQLVPAYLNSAFTQATTRAEFAHLAVVLYESQRGEITGRSTFADTDDVTVQKAAYIGVVQGVGDGRFNPAGTLTREQAATMLARLAYAIGNPLPEQAATFADNNAVSSWAIDAVGQVQAAGIMGGVGDNMFSPRGSYTREQSIVTMLRLFDFVD